jgi:hypothetical protein
MDIEEYRKLRHQDKGLKKVTFNVRESVVTQLNDRYLQLQYERGKPNVPAKEVMVEEAIAIMLDQLESNLEDWIQRCQERQTMR